MYLLSCTCCYKICFAVVEIDLFNKEKTSTKYRERLKSCVTSINRLGLSCDFLLTWNPNGNTNVAAKLFFSFFIVRLLSDLRGHSVFSSPSQRPMTSDFEGFSIPDVIHYIYFPILILEKEPVFSLLNVEC